MNREEYLNELQKYLKKLPHEDYLDAMDYFTEYFDEAGDENEQAIIHELGSPKKAANDVLNQLLQKQAPNWSSKQTLGLISLAILAAPIGIPLAMTLFMLVLTAILLFFSLLLTIVSLMIAGILVSGKLVLRGIVALPFSLSGGLLLIGLGVLLFGFGCICILVLPKIWQTGKKTILKFLALFTSRKKVLA